MHSSRMRTAAAVGVCWGVSASVYAGIHPLGLGLDTLLGCGPGPPGQTPPQTSPIGLGLDTPTSRPDPPNLPRGPGPRHLPPVDRMTDRCKNINCANFVCER